MPNTLSCHVLTAPPSAYVPKLPSAFNQSLKLFVTPPGAFEIAGIATTVALTVNLYTVFPAVTLLSLLTVTVAVNVPVAVGVNVTTKDATPPELIFVFKFVVVKPVPPVIVTELTLSVLVPSEYT